MDIQTGGQSAHQHVRRPGQRLAVIELAGTLRNQLNRPGPGPIPICGIEFILAALPRAGGHLRTAQQRRSAFNDLSNETFHILERHLGDRGNGSICATGLNRCHPSLRHIQEAMRTRFILVVDLRRSLQNPQGGDTPAAR